MVTLKHLHDVIPNDSDQARNQLKFSRGTK